MAHAVCARIRLATAKSKIDKNMLQHAAVSAKSLASTKIRGKTIEQDVICAHENRPNEGCQANEAVPSSNLTQTTRS